MALAPTGDIPKPRRLIDVCLFTGDPDVPDTGDVVHPLSTEADTALRRISRGKAAAATVVLTAACAVVLGRCLGRDTVTLDVPSRDATGFRPLTVSLAGVGSLRDLLTHCQECFTGQYAPTFGAPPDVAVTANADVDTAAAHDLVVRLVPGEHGASLCLTGRLPAWFRADLAVALDGLLDLLSQPDQPLSAFHSLLERRVAAQVVHFNSTERPYPADVTVLDMFRHHVRDQGDAVAVMAGPDLVTYRELDAITGRLAAELRHRLGVEAGQVVAALPDRDRYAPALVLGILASGAVYLPLHPDWPVEKMRRVLTNAGAVALVTRDRHRERATRLGTVPVLDLDQVLDSDAPPLPAVAGSPSACDPAYLIFTSGTTGVPKGVLVGHEGLVNTTVDHITRLVVTPEDRYLQFMALSFDGFLLDMFTALCAGATLVVASGEAIRDPDRFTALVDESGATLSTITPSYLSLLDPARLSRLRVLVSAGEVLGAGLAHRLAAVTTVYNGYGPTETTVNATLHRVDPDRRREPVPIGAPSANKRLHVVDEHFRQQPVGVLGEICIGGVGLAHRYINEAALTKEKFVADPFTPGETLYRTGDRGAWTPDGELLFQGRVDDQVKVNGHRIDLREIEEVLLAHPDVRTALVSAVQPARGGTEIVAFHRSDGLTAVELDRYLTDRLVAYMRPHRLVPVTTWPLTPHGKTDVVALRALLTRTRPVVEAVPVTSTEQALARIWQEVLGRTDIGVEQSLHALGADSLRVIEAAQRAQRQGIPVDAADILRTKTVRDLARLLDERRGDEVAVGIPLELVGLTDDERAALPADIEDAYPAALMQTFMIERYAADTGHTGAYLGTAEWTFTDSDLDADAVVEAIQRLWAGHRSLRSGFMRSPHGRDLVLVRPARPLTVPRHDLSGRSRVELDRWFSAEIVRETGKRFDAYGDEPLVRFRFYRTGPHQCSVFFSFHHALLDGWSGIELRNALFTHYREARSGRSAKPAPEGRTDSYREFVALEQEILRSEPARRYWCTELNTPDAKSAIAATRAAFARPSDGSRKTAESAFPAGTGQAVAEYAHAHGVSVRAVFLSAVCQSLTELFDLPELVTAVVTNGRSERLSEPLRATGLFWNMAPFITTAAESRSVSSVQQRLDAFAPFGSLPLLSLESDVLRKPLVAPVFNFVHFRNAGQGAERFAEGVVQSRFHFPLTFFVKYIGEPGNSAVRVRIDADPTVLPRGTFEDLRDLLADNVTTIIKGRK